VISAEVKTSNQIAARLQNAVALAQRGEKQLDYPDIPYVTALNSVSMKTESKLAKERIDYVLQKSAARDRRACWDSGRYQTHVIGEFRHNQSVYEIGKKLVDFGI
jgi:hypothetical protein